MRRALFDCLRLVLLLPAWATPTVARAAHAIEAPPPGAERMPPPPAPRGTASPADPADAPLASEMQVQLSDEFDWLRTTSGEWIKGSMQSMRQDSLTFSSKQFGTQTVGWSDTAVLYCNQEMIYVLDNRDYFVGTATLVGDQLTIETDAGPVTVDKQRVMSIVPRKTKEISRWSFKANLGASGRTGNTETIDYTAFARLRRIDRFTKLSFEYNGAYGLASDEVITNKHRGNTSWDWFVSRSFYLTPVAGEGLYDQFQNIRLRSIVSTGVGFHVVDSAKVNLDLEAAIGWIHGEAISGQPEANYDEAVAIPRGVLEWTMVDNVQLDLSWSSGIVFTALERTFHRGNAKLTVGLTDIVNLSSEVTFDRLESPAPRQDGTVPVENDLAVSLGVGITLD